jgi:hypothetical protein
MSRKQLPVVVDGVMLDRENPEHRVQIEELATAAIRLRNFGGSITQIAAQLKISEPVASQLVSQAVAQIRAVDADEIAARHSLTLADMRRALYPGIAQGDTKSHTAMLGVLNHEAKMHGIYAPTKLRLGLDQEEFETTVEEDVRALGVHPRMDTPLDVEIEEDDGWSNT